MQYKNYTMNTCNINIKNFNINKNTTVCIYNGTIYQRHDLGKNKGQHLFSP